MGYAVANPSYPSTADLKVRSWAVLGNATLAVSEKQHAVKEGEAIAFEEKYWVIAFDGKYWAIAGIISDNDC